MGRSAGVGAELLYNMGYFTPPMAFLAYLRLRPCLAHTSELATGPMKAEAGTGTHTSLLAAGASTIIGKTLKPTSEKEAGICGKNGNTSSRGELRRQSQGRQTTGSWEGSRSMFSPPHDGQPSPIGHERIRLQLIDRVGGDPAT